MVLVFIKCSNSFAVNNEDFKWWLSSLSLYFDWLCPNPKTLYELRIEAITLVQGLIVGPTPKPSLADLPKMILLRRKDFPVLYFPATAMIPILSFKFFNKSTASGLT
jgi:hypothetical protein